MAIIAGVIWLISDHDDEKEPPKPKKETTPAVFKDYDLDKYRTQVLFPDNANNLKLWLKKEGLSDQNLPAFQSCLSEYAFTKEKTLKISEVLGWCKNEFENNKKRFESHINLDPFFSNFSAWDGSYSPLERAIKKSMNDPSSYKHSETRYRLVLTGKGAPYAIVGTEFRGKNGFGAVVKDTATVKVNLKTLDMEEVK